MKSFLLRNQIHLLHWRNILERFSLMLRMQLDKHYSLMRKRLKRCGNFGELGGKDLMAMMAMNVRCISSKVLSKICVGRPLARQYTLMSSENGSDMKYLFILIILIFQTAKIGDLILRSLQLCQKYVRSQHGKDPSILAKYILETNEIVLV